MKMRKKSISLTVKEVHNERVIRDLKLEVLRRCDSVREKQMDRLKIFAVDI